MCLSFEYNSLLDDLNPVGAKTGILRFTMDIFVYVAVGYRRNNWWKLVCFCILVAIG